jgi:drug/metabolite transporter (DMT)-like permease
MKSRNSTTALITNALLWATAMIVSSVILKGTEYSEKMMYLLLALSTSSFLIFPDGHKSIKSEWRCIQKLFSPKQ